MAAHTPLTDGDLARPAKELPLKVIRVLGHQLHRHLPSSGNWEILAEELGYGYDNIKQFATMATVRQEATPGELLLRDWVEQGGCVGGGGSGHTLYVLRDALARMGRQDCAEIMEKEVYNNVIHMELTVCIQDATSHAGTQHLRVRTRTDTSLLNSLQNILQQPLETSYTLLDPGASWTRTLARQYKGRALMLQKTAAAQEITHNQVWMDQDPTVDSSGMTDETMIDEPGDMPQNWAPTPAPRVTRPRAHSSTVALPSAWQPTCRQVPGRQRSVTVPHTERNMSTQQMRRSYPNEIANPTQRVVVNSEQIQNQITHSRHLCRYHRECSTPCGACTSHDSPQNDLNVNYTDDRPSSLAGVAADICDTLPQNDLNVNHADNTPSSSAASKDEGHTSNLHVVNHDQMNICVSEGKLDNITTAERSDTDSANNSSSDVDMNPNMFEAVHIEASECSDSTVSENCSTTVTNDDDDMMVAGADNYQKSFNDIMDDSEYRDDFETFDKSDQTHKMSSLKSSFDETPQYFGTSMTELKLQPECDSLDEDEDETSTGSGKSVTELKVPYQSHSQAQSIASFTTSSSESDKEFVEHKVTPLRATSERGVVGQVPGDDKHTDVPASHRFGDANECQSHLHQETMGIGIDDSFYEKEKVHPDQFDNLPQNVPKALDRDTCVYPYIDFNKYPQTCSISNRNTSLSNENTDITAANDEPNGDVNVHRAGYESLQRHISCPADFHPYGSPENTEVQFSTIADVFSPVTENPPDLIVKQQRPTRSFHEDHAKYLPENNPNRWQSFSGRPQGKAINTNKTHRHTFAQGQKNSAPSVHFTDQVPWSVKCTDSAGHSWQEQHLSHVAEVDSVSIPPPSPHKFIKTKPHPYKVLVRGRLDRRSSLDAALVGDNLFSFYNNKLRGEPGWSPLETEDTVEGTMRDVLHQDGFYLLWYNRAKRNLMITVSDLGECIHIRVRSKVHHDHLHFYVVPSVLHREVHQLLGTCLEQGLGLQHPGNKLQGTRGRQSGRVWMRCPVTVQYERKPAVSV